MSSIFRRFSTVRVPQGARLFEREGKRFAEWKGRDGRKRTAEVKQRQDGSLRALVRSPIYFLKYRDGQGIVRERSSGCHDETAARAVLADLERRSERVRSGVVSGAEDAVAEAQAVPLREHIEAYISHLEQKGVSPGYRKPTKARILRVAGDLRWSKLSDLSGEDLERWLSDRASEGMGPGNRNEYRGAWVRFSNWAVRQKRMVENLFRGVVIAPAKEDRRRKRRALAKEELERLLRAAQERPLARVSPRAPEHVRRRAELLGLERALVYKVAATTGLRRNEIRSLRVSQADLEGNAPCLHLEAADAKNDQAAVLPLRGDLREELRAFLDRRLRQAQEDALRHGEPVPLRIPPQERLVLVPSLRAFDRDLSWAGIPKKNAGGRVADFHSLRVTFCTLLSAGGVTLRIAQAAMRHSDPSLTANVYTDTQLLDVRGALKVLPSLPVGHLEPAQAEAATGTAGAARSALRSAPTPEHSSKLGSIQVHEAADSSAPNEEAEDSEFPGKSKKKPSPAGDTSEGSLVDLVGVEPTTSALRRQRTPPVSITPSGLTGAPHEERAGERTGEPEKGPASPASESLRTLAEAILRLSVEDRARLVAELLRPASR